jgi:Mg/Co/Ni transporter MgtE
MGSFRQTLWRAVVTGALWALVGGLIAFVLLPIYLYGFRPWEHALNEAPLARVLLGGHSAPGAPSRAEVLEAAAGFALLGAAVGFVGGFLKGLQEKSTDAGTRPTP